MTAAALRGVGHTYAAGSPWEHRALQGVDLHIDDGERVLIAGRNGSGKSTLAWILAGLATPTEGSVDIARPALLAFQHARLQLFRSTVQRDVRWGAEIDDAGVDAALELVGLDAARFRDRRIDDLSGGEQRRVALAGLVVRHPKLLVLDEPLAGLDVTGRAALSGLLDRVHAATGAAVIVVSHDLADADRIASRTVVIESGEIIRDDTTE